MRSFNNRFNVDRLSDASSLLYGCNLFILLVDSIRALYLVECSGCYLKHDKLRKSGRRDLTCRNENL